MRPIVVVGAGVGGQSTAAVALGSMRVARLVLQELGLAADPLTSLAAQHPASGAAHSFAIQAHTPLPSSGSQER